MNSMRELEYLKKYRHKPTLLHFDIDLPTPTIPCSFQRVWLYLFLALYNSHNLYPQTRKPQKHISKDIRSSRNRMDWNGQEEHDRWKE
jgi:hypothetical protein